MHALPQRRTTRLAMLAGAAAMGAALIGGPAKAAEPSAPVPTATATVTATPAAKPKTKSAAQAKRNRVLALAKKYSGRSARWSSAGPQSLDGSGFARFIFQKVGITLSRSGAPGKKVSRTDARPGDLVVVRDSAGRVDRVGIYAGGNKMYDAPASGKAGRHPIWSKNAEFRRVL